MRLSLLLGLIFTMVNSFDKLGVYELLFPNQTYHMRDHSDDPRQLTTVPCVVCRNLQYCQALNNLMVQENYYPENLNLLGSCFVLEALGKRMNSEIFGPGKSFRDTSECRGKCLTCRFIFQFIIAFHSRDGVRISVPLLRQQQ
jgi:hypothetical protein